MRTRRTGIVIALLALSLLCSVSLLAQDNLLVTSTTNNKGGGVCSVGATPSVNYSVALCTAAGGVWTPTNPTVNCAAYAVDGVTCIAGQYYHSDNTKANATWNPLATSTAFGNWIEGNGSSSGCLSCHHGSITTAARGGGYLIGGHKNMMRKVTPGQTLIDNQGVAINAVIDHSSNAYTLSQTTGQITGTAGTFTANYLAGYLANGSSDVFGTNADGSYNSNLAYGSCARCHSTGYRWDGNAPEPTSYNPTTLAFTKLPASFAIPAGSVAPATSSWALSGIQCERCHKPDMQYDATVVNPNIGTVAVPQLSAGRISHFNNIIPNTVTANAATGQITGTDFYLSTAVSSTTATRPLPNPPYALTCVECHQNYATWTNKTAGQPGQIHVTPMPGFEALAPALNPSFTNGGKALTGEYTATFSCPGASPAVTTATPSYWTACTANGGTVVYTPVANSSGMSHGVVTTFLNSPHARVAGYVDVATPSSPNTKLTINGGVTNVNVGGTITSVNVAGGYNTHFASAGTADQGLPAGVTGATNGVTGSCAGCHDIHGDLVGYFNPEVAATNVEATTLQKCASCHQDGSRYSIGTPSHSQGAGTPYGINMPGSTNALESCVVCHMAAAQTGGTGQLHFLRINSDPNYYTFPTATQYYSGFGSGQLAPFNTYASTWNGSLETYTDGNGATQTYPAVGLDVDIACGQCHTGNDGNTNTYGIVPVGTAAPSFTRAQLASYAKGIHNSTQTVAATPTLSLGGSTYPASGAPYSVTISEAVANASICYTIDGTTPVYLDAGIATFAENVIPSCSNGTLATTGVTIAISKNTTLQALAAGANTQGQPLTPSAIISATYSLQAAAPVLVGGQFSAPQTLPLTGATGYCTAPAGTNCTTMLPVVGPLTISVPTTVRAVNAPANFVASAITTATFNVTLSAPTFAPPAGSISKGTTVVITGPAGSTIHYTTNGSNPTASSAAGTAGSGTASVVVAASEYVRAIAVYTSGTQTVQSAIATATYAAH